MTNDPSTSESLSKTGYVTRELAMAAYLALNGYTFDMRRDGESKSGHPVGSWIFADRDEKLGDFVRDFNNGDAQVEPTKFLNEVSNVRKAMFRFLGIPKQF